MKYNNNYSLQNDKGNLNNYENNFKSAFHENYVIKTFYWNPNSINKYIKHAFVKEKDPDIICLTEPVIFKNYSGYINYHNKKKINDTRCYVSISIRRNIQQQIIFNKNNFILIKINNQFGTMFIGCIYLSSNRTNIKKKTFNSFQTEIKKLIRMYYNPKIVIYGDFNTDLEKFNNGLLNSEQKRMMKRLLKYFKLWSPYRTFKHRNHNMNNNTSRLDWALSSNIDHKIYPNFLIIQKNISDHIAFNGKIYFNKENLKKKNMYYTK